MSAIHPQPEFSRIASRLLLAALLPLVLWTDPASAQDTLRTSDTVQVYELDPLTVRGRIDDLTGMVGTASVGFVGFRDLRLRPLLREAELLETVPGMILTQHSGSGKSNQMFVRGFNLDHGTDFSTRVEGMPINIPTHGHGQGYTDLNFLIPELVDHVEYSLGNYYADIGDFGSAGGAEMRLRRSLDAPLFVAGLGENGFRRTVAATSAQIGDGANLLVGAEYKGYDGPWERPEDANKLSGMARLTWQGQEQSFSMLALGYDNGWDASDQIPLRAVESGLVSRFGQIDPTLGGTSSRYSLSAAWDRAAGGASQRLSAYAVRYDLDLFSNFTYLLDDPDAGDQLRQEDDARWTVGGEFVHNQSLGLGGLEHDFGVGLQARADRADLRLSRSRAQNPVSIVRADEVAQESLGAFAQLETHWSPVVRTTLGLRADAFWFDVTSDRAANTGSTSDQILSPKFSLALGPWSGTEVYASAGLGFHSNDARGTVAQVDPVDGSPIDPVDPLVRSVGAELGLRSTPTEGLRTTFALWTVELESELLFVGDAGNTESSDPTRRVGVTLANFYRVTETVSVDADVSLTRARFLDVPDAVNRIPGAIENVIAAGASYEPVDSGVFGALRLRRFGQYPLVEDNAQRANANSLLNLNLGYQLGDARLTLSVLNLLNAEHSDIQYFYESRLQGEPAGGIGDVHFHPAEPRQFRISVAWGT